MCIYAMKGKARVLDHLVARRRSDVGISVITEAELRAGAAKSDRAVRTRKLLEAFLAPLTIVEFSSNDALEYATLRADLERAGTPIGPLDTLIAAQARARTLCLVTNNEREFQRVSGLQLENWTK
jgi:tRNA(fMet)-specific endonuclease VapC